MIIVNGVQMGGEENYEHLVNRVFFKSIDLLGGLKKLAEFRTLTWLPSLARAAFAVVLREEYLRTEDEIAQAVGLTRNTVRNILRADPNLAIYKIEHFDELAEEEKKELKVHTAGGIAKLAYKMVKEGNDAQTLLEFCRGMSEETASLCDIPWAYAILKKIKGCKYPINSYEQLVDRVRGVKIKGRDAAEVVMKISYPIKTPAALLKEISEYLKGDGE